MLHHVILVPLQFIITVLLWKDLYSHYMSNIGGTEYADRQSHLTVHYHVIIMDYVAM